MTEAEQKDLRFDWKAQLFSGGFLSHAAVFFLIVCLYFLTEPWWRNFDHAREICAVAVWLFLPALGVFLLCLRRQGRLNPKAYLAALIAVGIFLRVIYMLYTPFVWRGHDVGSVSGNGHYAYIYHLMIGQGLPQNYDNQFYHPPLMQLVSALFCKIASFFTRETDPFWLVDPAKIIACTASCSILFTSLKLGHYFRLKDSSMLLLAALSAFFPTYFILGASINNDVLMIALFMAAFYRTLLWKDDPSFKNILAVAFCIGLGMMTKLSAGLIALFTALVFLAVFIGQVRKAVKKQSPSPTPLRLFGEYAAFGAVCIPLALWYPIRNLVKFGQSLTYVARIPETSSLYCGDAGMVERFLSFPLQKLAETPYCNPRGDANLWLYTLRCSVFGEFTFENAPSLYAYGLLIFNLLLIVISLAAMFYVLIAGKKYGFCKRFAPAFIWLCLMGSFLHFNIQYPFGCTMDFRYIVPTFFVGAYYIALGIYDLPGRKNSLICRSLRWGTTAVAALFCAFSLLFYFG